MLFEVRLVGKADQSHPRNFSFAAAPALFFIRGAAGVRLGFHKASHIVKTLGHARVTLEKMEEEW